MEWKRIRNEGGKERSTEARTTHRRRRLTAPAPMPRVKRNRGEEGGSRRRRHPLNFPRKRGGGIPVQILTRGLFFNGAHAKENERGIPMFSLALSSPSFLFSLSVSLSLHLTAAFDLFFPPIISFAFQIDPNPLPFFSSRRFEGRFFYPYRPFRSSTKYLKAGCKSAGDGGSKGGDFFTNSEILFFVSYRRKVNFKGTRRHPQQSFFPWKATKS